MVSHLFFYQLALFVLVWLFVMLHLTGSQPGVTIPPVPAKPKRKRSTEPTPFAGLTQKPHCVWCEQVSLSRLNHGQPRVQTYPEIVQGATERHHEITDALLPQADPVFHNTTTLDAA